MAASRAVAVRSLLTTAADVRRRAAEERSRVSADLQQRAIDAEVRTTRRALLHALRLRLGQDAVPFLDEEFLAVADPSSLYEAILDAAVASTASAVDLQLSDSTGNVLRMTAHRGFPVEFLDYFAVLDSSSPTACATALHTRKPVLVDDVTRSAIFADRPTLPRMLEVGSRAVHSYPLPTPDGRVGGVLSFHYARCSPKTGAAPVVARAAAHALAITHGVGTSSFDQRGGCRSAARN